jgi:HAD superfamily hydrolase (TIGR01509 family)
MPIRAIIFDFDGLILDTESPSLQCWQELYTSYAIPFPLDQHLASTGRAVRLFDPYEHLVTTVGPPLTLESLRTTRMQRVTELAHAQSLCPGIEACVKAAHALSLKMAVASSSSRNWVDGHLQHRNLPHYFEALICKEVTSSHKPDPAPYRAALAALNVPASQAIALEDSPNGITAARAAGLFAVAIPNAITRQLDLSHAHLVIHDLAQFPLPDILARAQRR